MQLKAKDFKTRAELDAYALSLESGTIVGTREELARLHLSSTTKVHRLLCKETDEVPAKKSRVDRGKVHEFGLNKNNK